MILYLLLVVGLGKKVKPKIQNTIYPIIPPQSPKMRRNGFELKMQDRYSHFLAADSEAEMEDWVATLKQALQSSTEASQDRRNGAETLDCALGE